MVIVTGSRNHAAKHRAFGDMDEAAMQQGGGLRSRSQQRAESLRAPGIFARVFSLYNN
jgi:hypothetical protein